MNKSQYRVVGGAPAKYIERCRRAYAAAAHDLEIELAQDPMTFGHRSRVAEAARRRDLAAWRLDQARNLGAA